MKIPYKKRSLKASLILGIVFLLLLIVQLYFDKEFRWHHFGYLFLALVYFSSFYHRRYNNLVLLENGTITVNSSFGNKKLTVSEITGLEKFMGNYVLHANKRQVTINTRLMDREHLEALEQALTQLNLPSKPY